MSELLDKIKREKHERWLQDWSQGLAFCLTCDHEYTEAQAIEIEDEKSCPSCKKPEHKTFYYCPKDGSRGCDCRH